MGLALLFISIVMRCLNSVSGLDVLIDLSFQTVASTAASPIVVFNNFSHWMPTSVQISGGCPPVPSLHALASRSKQSKLVTMEKVWVLNTTDLYYSTSPIECQTGRFEKHKTVCGFLQQNSFRLPVQKAMVTH